MFHPPLIPWRIIAPILYPPALPSSSHQRFCYKMRNGNTLRWSQFSIYHVIRHLPLTGVAKVILCHCPCCRKKLKVPLSLAGTNGPCPRCKNVLKYPSPKPVAAGPAVQPCPDCGSRMERESTTLQMVVTTILLLIGLYLLGTYWPLGLVVCALAVVVMVTGRRWKCTFCGRILPT